MSVKFYKYHGAGNDFILIDNRDGSVSLNPQQIRALCDRRTGIGADGLMLLCEPEIHLDFSMEYFNSDGSGGMMCGNGGRCMAAFASEMNVAASPSDLEGFDKMYIFAAPDGLHKAYVRDEGEGKYCIRLQMKNVCEVAPQPDGGVFLDTGTRHLVRFVEDVAGHDVVGEGRILRNDSRFAPIGTNVNFVEPAEVDGKTVLKVRTFEKGVEDETLACGTGIVASAVAASLNGVPPTFAEDSRVSYDIEARISRLKVDFATNPEFPASDVWLTGPAEKVFDGTIGK